MLSPDIQSTSELLSHAIATDREATRFYSELSAGMFDHGNSEASAVYENLIDEVWKHQRKLSEWADLEGLKIDPEATPIDWENPGVITYPDVEAKDPYRCTPFMAFALAAHREEHAFQFFTYVAANSQSIDVSQHAMALAQAQLDRVASLRALRRRAWHAQNEELFQSRIDPGVIHGIPDLLSIIVCIEQYLVRLLEVAAPGFPKLRSLATTTLESLDASKKALDETESPGTEVVLVLKKVTAWMERSLATTDPSAALRRLCADCDRCFAFYDSVVKMTKDESVMIMAQRQSVLAMQRTTELRAVYQRAVSNSS